jgi:hypothetical protein
MCPSALHVTSGPYKDDDAGIRTIRTRTAMFVPFELVTCLLGKDYTASEAFELCYPVLESDGLEASCAPFLEFLQLASTKPTTDNPRPVTLQDEMGLVRHAIRPAVVKHRRESVLYRLLPDLRPGTGLLPDAFALSMSTGLTSIATEMHSDLQAWDARAAESTRKKTFRDKYGERIADSILILTGASDDDFLPAYYQELGGRQKGESERVLLQREVDQSA